MKVRCGTGKEVLRDVVKTCRERQHSFDPGQEGAHEARTGDRSEALILGARPQIFRLFS